MLQIVTWTLKDGNTSSGFVAEDKTVHPQDNKPKHPHGQRICGRCHKVHEGPFGPDVLVCGSRDRV